MRRLLLKKLSNALTFDFLNWNTKCSSVCYVPYPFTTFDAHVPQDTDIENAICHLFTSIGCTK